VPLKWMVRPVGKPTQAKPSLQSASSSSSEPVWLHASGTQKEAASRIEAAGPLVDGMFIVYPSKDGHALAVVFKGKVTHHRITKGDDGVF
jgi:hypothetical protein